MCSSLCVCWISVSLYTQSLSKALVNCSSGEFSHLALNGNITQFSIIINLNSQVVQPFLLGNICKHGFLWMHHALFHRSLLHICIIGYKHLGQAVLFLMISPCTETYICYTIICINMLSFASGFFICISERSIPILYLRKSTTVLKHSITSKSPGFKILLI